MRRWTVVLAMFLSRQMVEGDDGARAQLHKVAMEAAARVLGPLAMYPPGARGEWAQLQRSIAPHQHPLGPAGFSEDQDQAARRLEAQLPPYSCYFGLAEHNPIRQGDDYPPRLRLASDGEIGTPFDELVLEKVGDPASARDVFAFVQEWDRLTDELGRSPSISEYAERWGVDRGIAEDRNQSFRELFPTEETPERVVRLLWSGMPSTGGFMRLLGQRVIETDAPRTVISRFVDSLAFELRNVPAVGQAVYRAAVTFEARDTSPSRELRRFFALCDRAFRTWAAQALAGAGQAVALQGLLSIGSIYDERSAGYAEQMLGEYRRGLPAGPARQLLLAVQKTVRVAASLDALNPPPTGAPYLEGVTWAAKALATATAPEIPLDIVVEAGETTRMLDSVH